jgi:hypothetical protein
MLNLEACLLRQGRIDESERYFKKLLGSDTHVKEAQANLNAINSLRIETGGLFKN